MGCLIKKFLLKKKKNKYVYIEKGQCDGKSELSFFYGIYNHIYPIKKFRN